MSATKRFPSTPDLLGVLFVALKLCHVITWSWWLVTLPFWALGAAMHAFLVVLLLVVLVGAVADKGLRAGLRETRGHAKAMAKTYGKTLARGLKALSGDQS